MYASADELHHLLRQQALQVPGLIRLAIERADDEAQLELIDHVGSIERAAYCLRRKIQEHRTIGP